MQPLKPLLSVTLLLLALAIPCAIVSWMILENVSRGGTIEDSETTPSQAASVHSELKLLEVNVERTGTKWPVVDGLPTTESGWILVAILILFGIVFAVLAKNLKDNKFLRWIAYISSFVSLLSAIVVGAHKTALMVEAWGRVIGASHYEDARGIYLLRRTEATRRAVFPLFFEDAVKSRDGWSKGTELEEKQCESLRPLVEALAGCVDPSGDEQIQLSVVGYASSARFKGRHGMVSEAKDTQLNLEAANLRAESAVECLHSLIVDQEDAAHAFEVKAHEWKTFEAMARARPYYDREGSGTRAQELLNRTAEVELVRAGKCESLYRSVWQKEAD